MSFLDDKDNNFSNLGMKSVLSSMNVPLNQVIGNYVNGIFTRDWIFDKWYEKLIIAISWLGFIASIVLLILGIIVIK